MFYSGLLLLAIWSVSSASDHSIKKRLAWHEESNLYWAENCDWAGNDIGSVQVPGAQCGAQCAGRSGCTRFTWTKFNGGTCWLKTNKATLDQATASKEYSVCGLMKGGSQPPPPPPPPGGSGKAQVRTINKCSYTIWVGAFGTQFTPANGGWRLNPGESKTVDIPITGEWNGRFWGRTDCDNNGRCSTGSCSGLECKGTTGQTPASLAEITFNGHAGLDYYDVSLVDGYNIPIQMRPIAGTFSKGGGDPKYDCTQAGCVSDLNAFCPNELAVRANGRVVGCKSACEAFNTDAYCCRGAHDKPETCPPTNYSNLFKRACPDAYSYAYDDHTSTFTCRGANGAKGASYEVQFC